MNMKKYLAMLAMLLGTGGTAVADNISVVVRSWDDTEKQVIVKTETHDCEDISGWSDSGWPTMDGSQGEKWYYVKQDKTFGSRPLIAKGKVHLVIPDGVTLTLNKGLRVLLDDNANLHIHSQQGESGKLVATGDDKIAAIGGQDKYASGSITVHGGIVNATGGEDAAGIGYGGRVKTKVDMSYLTFLGGKVTSKGGENGSGIGGANTDRAFIAITIYPGADIEATGGYDACGIGLGPKEKNSGGVAAGPRTRTRAGVTDKRLIPWAPSPTEMRPDHYAICLIDIKGGTVKATGGEYGSGIGIGCAYTYLPENSLLTYINITSGEVNAKGGLDASGIGIGRSYDNTIINKGLEENYGARCFINIDGDAVVRSEGNRYGAGIGGGENRKGGDVAIYGNARVTAIAGNKVDARTFHGGTAIGVGDCDMTGTHYDRKEEACGDLNLGDNMRVRSGDSSDKIENTHKGSDRVYACRWRNCVEISPCEHLAYSGEKEINYTYTMSPHEGISADYHEKHCPYCATAIQEQHQYVDGTCVCGKQKEVKAVSMVTLNWPKDAQDAAFTGGIDFHVNTGQTFRLPEHKAPEGIDFMGWARTSTKPASIYLLADEDEESLLHPGEEIKVEGDVKIYTRYRKVYQEEWKWADDKKSCQLTITCPYDGDTRTISAEVKTEEEAATEEEPGYTLYSAVAEYDGISYVDYFYDMHYYTIELKDDQDNQATLDKFKGKTVNVNLNRTLSAKKQADGTWQSDTWLVCLPYDFNLPESVVKGEEADVYKLHKIDNEKKEFIFTNEFPSLSAGEPYLIVVKKGEFGLSAEGVEIISEPKEGTAVYDAAMSKVVGRFKGTFKKFTAEEGIKANAYGMRDGGKWTRYRNGYDGWETRYVKTFRCYFSFDEPTNIDEYMMKFVRTENGDMETGEVTDFPSEWFEGEEGGSDDPTGIGSVRVAGSDTRLYDLQGRRVEGQPAKGLYISNGKKIIIK
jgi:hypothetical protein